MQKAVLGVFLASIVYVRMTEDKQAGQRAATIVSSVPRSDRYRT